MRHERYLTPLQGDLNLPSRQVSSNVFFGKHTPQKTALYQTWGLPCPTFLDFQTIPLNKSACDSGSFICGVWPQITDRCYLPPNEAGGHWIPANGVLCPLGTDLIVLPVYLLRTLCVCPEKNYVLVLALAPAWEGGGEAHISTHVAPSTVSSQGTM